MNKTVDYYDAHAAEYFSDTIEADMSDARARFLSHLPSEANILDFGCGSGRDSLIFIEQGYRVEAVDGSLELCRRAESIIHQPVQQMRFEELSVKAKYDGIWACASLLHVPKDQIRSIFDRVAHALRIGGVFYLSVKQGDFEGERNGRFFADYQFDELEKLLKSEDFEICEYWISKDVRPYREDVWINVIAKLNK